MIFPPIAIKQNGDFKYTGIGNQIGMTIVSKILDKVVYIVFL